VRARVLGGRAEVVRACGSCNRFQIWGGVEIAFYVGLSFAQQKYVDNVDSNCTQPFVNKILLFFMQSGTMFAENRDHANFDPRSGTFSSVGLRFAEVHGAQLRRRRQPGDHCKSRRPRYENFMTIWYILWPFGIIYGHLVYILWTFGIFCGQFGLFSPFGMLHREKSGNPD
jgi:hypothetical protein